jgi:hypothetical protein
MFAHRYTQEGAERLVPMLRSIGGEIGERTRNVEQLERSLERGSSRRHATSKSTALRGMEAELAQQRRELRLAKQELARFGCSLEGRRVLIPGEDGTPENGFAWCIDDDRLLATTVQLAA